MDFIWILFAFFCGLGIRLCGLPPLIGFLIAGFLLNIFGVQASDNLQMLGDLGITLMLFTIGLKLNIGDLFKREVLLGGIAHMSLWVILATSLLLVLSMIALPHLANIDVKSAALIGFSLSFSSTVCVVKLLEESGETRTRHGKLAIGVLIIQDIIAVFFLVLAKGQIPSPFAILLLLIVLAGPLLNQIMVRVGHGELLPLTGFFLALGGYELFELVGIKGDLGALVLGIILSKYSKANELAKSLLSFKDLFLIGFFLSIGLIALPNWEMLTVSFLICLLLPIKFLIFFFLFTRMQLRGRTSFLSSLALNNYSEFGLIVAYLSLSAGWLSKEWLVISAISVSISFVFTNIIYRFAHKFYAKYSARFRRFETETRLPEDQLVQPKKAEILVIGAGQVGLSAFTALHNLVGDKAWAMDADRRLIKSLQQEGYHVFVGDGEDADLWHHIDTSSIRLVLLALPTIRDNKNVTHQLRLANYKGKIAAIVLFDDQRAPLLSSGIDTVFDFYTEAGMGFAEDSLELIGYKHRHVTSKDSQLELSQ